MQEFVPLEHFRRLASRWWVIVVAILLGALAGFIFHYLTPPQYEAVAIYLVQTDLEKMPILDIPRDQFVRVQDMAVSTTEAVIESPILLELVTAEAARQGIQVDAVSLIKNSTVERRLTFWYLRYRHADPQIAQATVEIWAAMAHESMLSLQASGNIAGYVMFGAPEFQPTPTEPVLYQRNHLMLAGMLAGAVVGIFLADVFPFRRPKAA
ncbi:MAG TPA: Wzz/FepE/Etk N-terminal domain-containing protein [Anaerolineales bacterium]|nr:Wzz/FepE/Etk N-terminal domain-containing protein [Anaerolineales bacterium]